MRTALSIVFGILILALLVCMELSRRSKKPIGKNVAFAMAGLAVPVLGNLIIIASTEKMLSLVGYYIYFFGMDIAVYSIWRFTFAYCNLKRPKKAVSILLSTLLGLDLLQYILNPFFSFTFIVDKIMVEGEPYVRLIPHLGQTYHRIVCYGMLAAILVIYIVKIFSVSRVYRARYNVIFFSMMVMTVVESYYIFSRQPMDISMIGFAVFGFLIYFFALHYRSMQVVDRMLGSMASDMPEALFFFDNNGKCIWLNDPGKKLIGINNDNYDDVKNNLAFLFDDIDLENSGWAKRFSIGEGEEAQFMYLTMRSAVDERGKITGTYLSVRDITDEQNELRREMYNATHDSLTGLYTAEYLYEKIDQRLNTDRKTTYMVAFFEVANFKMINDVFGREFGKLVLTQIAQSLKKYSSANTLYGRLSTDSFGMLMVKELFNEERIEKVLENFIVKDDNMEHHIVVHLGICEILPEDDIDVPLFFDSARLAASMIKSNYQKQIVYYDDNLRNEIIHNQLISNQVKEAIETRQIRPYLQPIVDSQGLLAGAEALVRWIHPEEGFMNPGQFIPVFERNGLIADVDKHMWRCACEILADWKERGIKCFISINISPNDFISLDVLSELRALVEEFDIDPVRLRIEITETSMVSDTVDMIKIIEDLREYGFIVEMDDFGSGYSSLNLLKDINLDVIKIDMQFLKDSERNLKSSMIIKNIINMSEDLGIDTLTEGVETAKQFELLYDMGCNLYQGYYFSKPLPLEDFEVQWFD